MPKANKNPPVWTTHKWYCPSRRRDKFWERVRQWARSTHKTSSHKCICSIHRRSKINWTVDDSLYNWFLKWKIKCKNILDCELALLSEAGKCKKIVAWSGDFGIDQFISWDLTPEETCLEVIWQKFEEFCKPQTNQIRARFDLLTSFRQGDCSGDEWCNAVQAQINLAKYPQELARILQGDIFWFFLKDEQFVSRTINDSNIDLDTFPAS